MTTMRALVFDGPRDLPVRKVPLSESSPAEMLVRVTYAGICGTYPHLWHGMPGVTAPVIVGREIVGQVAASDTPELPPRSPRMVTRSPKKAESCTASCAPG